MKKKCVSAKRKASFLTLIYYAWRKINHTKLTETEITTTEHKY